MAIVNEVITKFSFRGSTGPLSKFNSALGFSIKGLAGVVTGIGAATAAVTAFTVKTAASLDPMIQLSRTTGVAVDKIQELGYIASVSGSNLGAVEGTIKSLSQRIGEAATRGSEDFARLGISVRGSNGEIKKADQVLAEVGGRFNQLGLSRAEQISFAEKLGIDASLIQLLNRSSGEMGRLSQKAKSLGLISKDGADAAASLTDSYTTLKFGITSLQNSLAIGLAPIIEDTANRFTDFMAQNRKLIGFGINKTVEIFKAFGQSLKRMLPIFGPFIAGLAAIAALVFVIHSPILFAIAAIGALYLVIDDLIVAFRGGDSVLKDFAQTLFGIDITPGLKKIAEFLKWTLKIVADIGVAIANAFEFKDIGGLSKIGEGVLGGIGTAGKFWKDALFGGGGGSNTSNNSVTQNVKVNVSTTESAVAVADTMGRQLSNANDLMSRGGM